MDHSFAKTPSVEIPRSTFNRSHGHKTTFDAGDIIPIYVDEALPGDTFNMKMTGFARMSTPEFPIMDNLYMDTFFFSVPIRLLWDNFRKFMGEQTNPGDSIDYTIPQTAPTAHASGSLADYFGLPILTTCSHSALFHRAYGLIYNEWFRDQNLITSAAVATGDGPDTIGTHVPITPYKRGKRHDYFTSCLPWPQKGDAVTLPLGNTADVAIDSGIGSVPVVYSTAQSTYHYLDADAVQVDLSNGNTTTQTSKLYADLSSATAATINELRQAFQVQRLLERDARSGTRYSEVIKSHFGVNFVDATYRPEYLGGGSSPINVTPVVGTNQDGTNPQGSLAAFATTGMSGHGFTKSFTEHCIIMGFVNVRADLTYQQGMNRMFSRETRYDFFWPSLAQIGEQAVLNKEIYYQNTSADDDVFGYQERYAEYRYKPSIITGQFRSTHPTSLDAWHLSQEFASLPTLNHTFIDDDPPIDRVIATPSEPHFIMDTYFDLQCSRPMPLYGTPGMLDHF